MVHDNLQFHNTADLPPAPGGGLQICRFPSALWDSAEAPLGFRTIRSANGCEIRFVSQRQRVRLYLRSLSGEADLVLLMGNQIQRYKTLLEGGIQCLEIGLPEENSNIESEVLRCGGFSPHVLRVASLNAPLAYHGIEAVAGTLRPPSADELPRHRWMAYGSSITEGGNTFHNYVNAAAQMLEADTYNLGMGGSCWIEPAIADFIAARDDWDFASFELGVNMRRNSRDNARFAEKVDYLLRTVTSAHPEKPLFLITHFRNAQHHEINPGDVAQDQREKDDILRESAARHPTQVHLVEGTAIAPDFRGFRTDLLHPEPFAYARMGLTLAETMRAVLEAG